MRRFGVTFVILLAFFCSPMRADNSQKDKIKKCNERATKMGLKGDDRVAFISTCSSAKEAVGSAANNMSPQDKTNVDKAKACEQEAKQKGLKGKDRRTFMSTCTSASSGK